MGSKRGQYDVIVVGAGHAGCEAALVAARMGCKTLLLSLNLDKIASMPCNPAVGGIGKGQLVREIDALGGEMGKNADESLLQTKILNKKKGPAVQALRIQTDKKLYEARMRRILEEEENLDLKQAAVTRILAEQGRVRGVTTKTGLFYPGKTAVIATGTFLQASVVIGKTIFPAGRMGEPPATELSLSLRSLGLKLGRFQTATPPRVDKRTVNFSKMRMEVGEEKPLPFSFGASVTRQEQLPCYLTYTNKETHKVVRDHLHLSPIKTGAVKAHGPRNCPSIDRKIINFPEKERHPVFVEPEGWETTEMYLQGLTTALPLEVQSKIIQATPGLEEAQIMRPGYAVEYDYLLPQQLHPTLESKMVEGLFAAGQLNGTTGYEEAAAQGLIAGVNAALKVKRAAPLILDRSQAYIGVLIDDLVTRGVDEPYRMLTSRAEYRLLLRSDNAHLRLSPIGHTLGLISGERYKEVLEEKEHILKERRRLERTFLLPGEEVNRRLKEIQSEPLKRPLSLLNLLRRPEIDSAVLKELDKGRDGLPDQVLQEVAIEAKYEGYIERQKDQIGRYKRLENKTIPPNLDYHKLRSLSFEAREKLSQVCPRSLGQASRIPGVTPADISILMVYLEQMRKNGIKSITS